MVAAELDLAGAADSGLGDGGSKGLLDRFVNWYVQRQSRKGS